MPSNQADPAAPAPRPLTHRRVLSIALPIMLSNATVPILGAVDTGVVGQLGEAAPIGAVGIGAIILGAIYWMFGFLRMGTVGLTSQALGAGDQAEADALLSRALLVAGAAGVMLILLQIPIFALGFLISPASAEVEDLARTYMAIRIWSAPAAIAVFGITGWLIAAERTRGVLVLQIWMNGLNILLDLWFVLQLGWGVEGVAFATFLAEWSGLAMGLWLCRDAFARPFWRQMDCVLDRVRLVRMAIVNRDIMIRSIILEAIMMSFLFYGAKLGDVPLAANQVLLQFIAISAFALDGFAFAAESLVGNAYGRRSPERVRRSVIVASLWGAVIGVVMALFFWFGGQQLVNVMTTAPDVRAEARLYLPWLAVSPLLGTIPWMLDGVFIGATRTRDMRNAMMSVAVFHAVSLAVFFPWLGNHGLWLSLIISYVTRGITLGLRYPALERAAATGG